MDQVESFLAPSAPENTPKDSSEDDLSPIDFLTLPFFSFFLSFWFKF